MGCPHRPEPPAHVLQPAQLYGDSGYLGSCENRGTPPKPCDSLIPHLQKVEAQPLDFQIPTWPLLASILGKPHKKTSFGWKGQALSSPERVLVIVCRKRPNKWEIGASRQGRRYGESEVDHLGSGWLVWCRPLAWSGPCAVHRTCFPHDNRAGGSKPEDLGAEVHLHPDMFPFKT